MSLPNIDTHGIIEMIVPVIFLIVAYIIINAALDWYKKNIG